MKIYLSNKMTGIPYFNAPWFDAAEKALLALPGISEVFNPADHDRKNGFDPMSCPSGTPEEARANGFKLDHALKSDWIWIADHADCVVVGPDWLTSLGAVSEVACIQALRKPAYEYSVFRGLYACHRRRIPVGSDLSFYAVPPILEVGKGERG